MRCIWQTLAAEHPSPFSARRNDRSYVKFLPAIVGAIPVRRNSMSEVNETIGSCICGAVHISPQHIDHKLGACHCNTCRKWGGGPYLSVDCGTDVSFEGEENISVFRSSKWAERGFCKQCGSHLFYRLKGSGQYFIPGALFGDELPLEFDHQVFIDEKPSYYTFANKTKDMTGAELLAKYGFDQE